MEDNNNLDLASLDLHLRIEQLRAEARHLATVLEQAFPDGVPVTCTKNKHDKHNFTMSVKDLISMAQNESLWPPHCCNSPVRFG